MKCFECGRILATKEFYEHHLLEKHPESMMAAIVRRQQVKQARREKKLNGKS